MSLLTVEHSGFHGHHTTRIRVKGNPGDHYRLSPSQVRKLKNLGCGHEGCKCGESALDCRQIQVYFGPFDDFYVLTIPNGDTLNVRGF